jgi:Ca-activated chloride channel family protein
MLQRTRFGTRIVQHESDLDEDTLTQIAETTGGRYFRAEDTAGLQQIYEAINALEKSQIETRVYTRYRELAVWLLAPALVLLLLELLLRNTVLRRIP